MSDIASLEALVWEVTVEDHPNADRLDVVKCGEYTAISGKGDYKTGDLAAFIPAGAIVQDWVLEDIGLTGKLAGKQKNRVKVSRLRGVLSEGILYPVDMDCHYPGENMAPYLHLIKYEPPVPVAMRGQVDRIRGVTLRYDMKNLKDRPDVFQPTDEVYVTEKLHGTLCQMGWHRDSGFFVTSKGLANKGQVLKLNEENASNLYVRMFNRCLTELEGIQEDIRDIFRDDGEVTDDEPFYVLGEIHGPGVQDLNYGHEKPEMAVFDIYIGEPGRGKFLNFDQLYDFYSKFEVFKPVPVLYLGPFNKNRIDGLATGNTTLFPGDRALERHIREGVVVKTVHEKTHYDMPDFTTDGSGNGRMIAKVLNPDYLARKRGTEYN